MTPRELIDLVTNYLASLYETVTGTHPLDWTFGQIGTLFVLSIVVAPIVFYVIGQIVTLLIIFLLWIWDRLPISIKRLSNKLFTILPSLFGTTIIAAALMIPYIAALSGIGLFGDKMEPETLTGWIFILAPYASVFFAGWLATQRYPQSAKFLGTLTIYLILMLFAAGVYAAIAIVLLEELGVASTGSIALDAFLIMIPFLLGAFVLTRRAFHRATNMSQRDTALDGGASISSRQPKS